MLRYYTVHGTRHNVTFILSDCDCNCESERVGSVNFLTVIHTEWRKAKENFACALTFAWCKQTLRHTAFCCVLNSPAFPSCTPFHPILSARIQPTGFDAFSEAPVSSLVLHTGKTSPANKDLEFQLKIFTCFDPNSVYCHMQDSQQESGKLCYDAVTI